MNSVDTKGQLIMIGIWGSSILFGAILLGGIDNSAHYEPVIGMFFWLIVTIFLFALPALLIWQAVFICIRLVTIRSYSIANRIGIIIIALLYASVAFLYISGNSLLPPGVFLSTIIAISLSYLIFSASLNDSHKVGRKVSEDKFLLQA